MGDYRKLEVWKLACNVADRVDALVAVLPRRTRIVLGDQLLRSADSVHLNIAEGCGLNSDRQLAKHTRVALGSANEVEDAIDRLNRRGLLPDKHADLLTDTSVLRRRLGAFLRTLNSDE